MPRVEPICAAAIMVVNGRSGPAPNMTRPASGPGAGADWFHASGFTLSIPAESATFPMHGWGAASEELLAPLARGAAAGTINSARRRARSKGMEGPGFGHEKGRRGVGASL